MDDSSERHGEAGDDNGRFDSRCWPGLLDERRWQRWQPPQMLRQAGVAIGQTALDLGSGPGFWTLPLAEIVGESGLVWALDSSDEMLAVLAGREPPAQVRLLRADLPAIPLPEASVDFVWAAFVFHEVAPPEALAAEARRVLRREGRLAVLEWRPDAAGEAGPPRPHRLAAARVTDVLRQAGFAAVAQRWSDPDNYLLVAD
ncbi:MAG: class I SAM-dependent methyltransferase [Anaerolineae bacterium]